jgi:hypothetical protein
VAVAERAQSRVLAALGAGAATLGVCLALVIQSRGALLGLAGSAAIVLALLPGRARRLLALGVVGAATAAVAGKLIDVYDLADPVTGHPRPGTAHAAAVATLIAVAVAGIVWFAVRTAVDRLTIDVRQSRRRAALVAVGLLVLAAAIGFGNRAGDEISQQWDSFRSLQPVSTSARLTTGGGNRYDYWRVALDQFRDHPVRGIGAGNYSRTYFLERRTPEDVRQPHSIEFQLLAENGLLGLLPFLVIVIAVAAAATRARRGWVARGEDERVVAVGALGVVAFWLVHTSVDWLHLLPGLTAGALLAAAVVMAEPRDRAAPRHRGPTLRPVAFAACALAVASVGVSLVADQRRDRAEALVATDPARAASLAQSALRIDDENLSNYIVLAAALARLGRYEPAKAALEEAVRREPHNFLPYALLGDLALRRGESTAAAGYYDRALTLNPRDAQVRDLLERARASA